MFDSKTIKKHKGKVIMMRYQTNGYPHEQVGIIETITKEAIIFTIEELRIPLTYTQILDIKNPEK